MVRTLPALAALSLAAATLLGACAAGPDYRPPVVETPQAFRETPGWARAQPADAELRGDWWTLFRDPVLDRLQARVDVDNRSLRAAMARYRQARAQIRIAEAAGAPQVGVGLNASRARVSNNVLGRSLAGRTTNDFILPVSVSWEPDLWGRIARGEEAAAAGAQASAADVETVRLAMHADLASSYFLVRTLDSESRLLEATVQAYRKALAITQERQRIGIASGVDISLARSQLDGARAQLADIALQRGAAEHAIATLIGVPASSYTLAPAADASRPGRSAIAAPPDIPVGLPSQLLQRRPDVAAAERRAAAANAQIGVAEASMFPALTLGGSGGVESAALSQLLSAPSRFWALGPALAGVIFDGGARQARTAQAQAGYDASVEDYRHSTLVAFQEVEDELQALRVLRQEALVQDRVVHASDQALALLTRRYGLGVVPYTDVVLAQTTALNNERLAVGLARRRLLASVLLVKALGGGWDRQAPAAG
ncbi:efflux transporter outer membrane subunit [Xylophilus rhododendri]|uniref:Efflux transporter outer membrane subunit n=1 Tax=Xylophilus rhododendri TaxID=2697032 RepID=A0A857J9D1_9BURK|nr:efflux transporter outer membrane subunit [Xylophilus rhododendri]QHJ00497.1 efflux transporter outer membrane subunit [Xylophilus rhododendri]